jgi:hypothetical protein
MTWPQLPWVRSFETIEELRQALLEFKRTGWDVETGLRIVSLL